ncbi:MAG: ATP-binding protein, partial [Anaerolineae bacterium]
PSALNPPDYGQSTDRAIFEQVTRVLQRLARHRTLLLALDDLQWADPGSVALLFHLGRRLIGSRILVVGAYRPGDITGRIAGERHPLAPVVHELQREFGDICIDLNESEGRAFVEALIDSEPNRLGPDFRATLTRHTGGNPLFTVELLRGLQEQGRLVQDDAGYWVAAADLAWEELPARVEAVIAERVARLPAAWQETLRIASVEGETFTAEVIARVQGVDREQMARRLSGPLSHAYRLIYPLSVRPVESDGRPLHHYRFRHILFQRYLYESLGGEARRRRHKAIGETLEALYGDRVEEIALELARHFEQAGRPDRAVTYLHAAGNRAYLFSAAREAIALFTHGLALLKELPETSERREQELHLQLALTGPLLAQRGWSAEERASALERAYTLAEQMDSAPELLQALFVLADLNRARGKHAHSLELGERMLDLARRSGDPEQLALADWTLGETQLFRGALPEAREYLERGLRHYDARLHRDLTSITGPNVGVTCMTWLAWTRWLLGYPDRALDEVYKALALAERLDHPLSLAFTLAIGAAGLHLLRREVGAAAPYTARLVHLVADETLTSMEPWAEVLAGVQQVREGAAEAGLARVREGMAAWKATGALSGRPFQMLILINLYRRHGEIEAALETVDEALALVDETGERPFEAEYFRLRGVLRAAQGATPSEVEAHFRTALTLAQKQTARSWALRSALSLARHLQQEGRKEEARKVLAPIYENFTEGFDTPDLQEAQALLG